MRESEMHFGPLVYARKAELWLWHDPLGIGRQERYIFTLPLLDAISLDCHSELLSSGEILASGPTYCDVGVFGGSLAEGCQDGCRVWQRHGGHGLSVRVVARLTRRACFLADGHGKSLFLSARQHVFFVPTTWKNDVEPPGWQHDEETFILWKDGHETDDMTRLKGLLQAFTEQDVMRDARPSPLRVAQ